MEGAIDRDVAAETLRSVEGLRRKTMAAARRPSPFEPLVFGLAALLAAPFGLLSREIWLTIVLGIALVSATAITDLHYKRQAVHRAAHARRSRTTEEVIVLAVLAVIVLPNVLGFMLSWFLFFPDGGPTAILLIAFAAAALVLAKRTHNKALGFAGALSVLSLVASIFIWADHWEFVAAALYGGILSGAGLVALAKKERAA
jgi:hypothetical protein